MQSSLWKNLGKKFEWFLEKFMLKSLNELLMESQEECLKNRLRWEANGNLSKYFGGVSKVIHYEISTKFWYSFSYLDNTSLQTTTDYWIHIRYTGYRLHIQIVRAGVFALATQ